MMSRPRAAPWRIAVWLAVLYPLGAAAQGNAPVALVEAVTGNPSGVGSMDYVAAGQVIVLGPKEGLVVDYLHSCVRETITGGTVTVGTEQSETNGGHVERERVQCDGGRFKLTADQAAKSGVMVYRAPPKAGIRAADAVIERRLYGSSPVVDLKGETRLLIERLDRPGERLDLTIPDDRLTRGSFYDFAAEKRTLSAGGIYRATVGQHSIVFEIDRNATPGNTPLVGRLLMF